ncbi:MarR family transcriptional regulator [Gordonia sp. SID5947]|uniref:MarR family winged helix-turn-helix transcriptional regulator n=1 Tax=Gordonia sp. SID5947 TaxID=2690315 RepID=UPI00136DA720|nr:MarR family transcriptional regulator [Gordonia sp. SID5947]MYR05630.1 MarR family transcriptional regulator [Gordonia sp. SID5947]
MRTTDSRHRAHTVATPTATELWFAMNSLVRDHAVESRARIDARVDMPFSRFRALRRIAVRDMTQSDLARRLGIDAPATSGIVNDLVDRGLVTREPHPTDRRYKVVTITDEGRRIVDSVIADPAIAPTMFATLDDAQRRDLGFLLDALREAAES